MSLITFVFKDENHYQVLPTVLQQRDSLSIAIYSPPLKGKKLGLQITNCVGVYVYVGRGLCVSVCVCARAWARAVCHYVSTNFFYDVR